MKTDPLIFAGHGAPVDRAAMPAATDDGPVLRQAFRELELGNYETSRGLAQSALRAARDAADLHLEGKALACLAHCDRVTQRLRRASETARRAVQIFQRVGDPQGETMALNTLSHTCMLLGRSDEAVEAALLSVALCDAQAPTPTTVVAHNCLGMAYCWSGNFDKASASLETAIVLAARCVRPMSAYQPRINQLWVEAARLANERYQSGSMPGLERMGAIVDECRRLERSGDELTFMPGMLPIALTISLSLKGLHQAWLGDLPRATGYAARALASLAPTPTWLDALVQWVFAEIAWTKADWGRAEAAFAAMRDAAIVAEHEQLVCLAHLLLIQIYELQGKSAGVAAESRTLRARERRMASEALKGREVIVDWQLGARRSERNLERALRTSRQFERWSLEDALTGIANRRRFEQALAERLPAAIADRRPLAVAMVDIDRFKAVNDKHTHQVGDKVLQAIAALLVATVRENDLPARLAGDEFVVLFSDANTEAAEEICQRIRAAIAAFDWEALASGLRVSATIGLGQATESDTVESLLHRSDKSMYEGKRLAGPAPA